MTDVFDAPVKPGFRVGVSIIVVSDEGRLSKTDHTINGLNNSQADQIAADLLDQVKNRVKDYSQFKSGPWMDLDEVAKTAAAKRRGK